MRRGIAACVLVAAFFFLHGVSCRAQTDENEMRRIIDSIANPPMDSDPSIVFDSLETCISIRDDSAPRKIRFTFSNSGQDALRITKVAATCGCTVPEYSVQPVLPGGRGEITVLYNPYNQYGRINRSVYVYTEASTIHPVARLTIKGEIIPSDRFRGYPAALGTLRAKRDSIDFGTVGREMRRTERILCVNGGSSSLKIKALPEISPDWVTIYTEPEVIAPGAEAELYVVIDGSLFPDGFSGRKDVSVILDGIDAAPSGRTLKLSFVVSE